MVKVLEFFAWVAELSPLDFIELLSTFLLPDRPHFTPNQNKSQKIQKQGHSQHVGASKTGCKSELDLEASVASRVLLDRNPENLVWEEMSDRGT